MMQVFATFDEAVALKPDESTVCGTLLKDGKPQYFHMPDVASEEEVRAASFEVREGRPMNQNERAIAGVIDRVRSGASA